MAFLSQGSKLSTFLSQISSKGPRSTWPGLSQPWPHLEPISFSDAWANTLTGAAKEGRDSVSSQLRVQQSITGEKASLQESEAADHTASIIRKQEMRARPQLVFSILFILESPVQGMICPQFRWILSCYLTQSRYPPTSMLRGLSPR